MAEKVICIMNPELAEEVSKIIKTIITNKEDLKGKFTVTSQDEQTKIDGSGILYIVDHDKMLDLENYEKLFGKIVILYHKRLDSKVIKMAMRYSAIGVFDATRFFGNRLEYSEIARFEETVKSYLRKKLKDKLLESKLSKPIDWKLKHEPDFTDKTITLFSDEKIRETIIKAKRIVESLKAYVEKIREVRKSVKLEELLQLELDVMEKRKLITVKEKYDLISESTEQSGIKGAEAILITGPTGSGKTVIARQIARQLYGEEFENFFSRVAVSNISENLVETELFGSFPGAFTGSEYKLGKILSNIGGIVFLDEIGEISPKVQAKLLTYMDDLGFQIEGYSNPRGIKAPVLIIAATNRNLEVEIKDGNFRADLYHRFRYKITVPSISERKPDLRYLISFLLQEGKEKLKSKIQRISIEALEKLESYDYPGNFRELESIIFEAIALAEFDERTCILARDIKI
ncbi:hypothetical protein AT15_00030 [Kosmotoga arenicorallina S304]|uniref:Sigma-54 factor interaction domain-containing protein n=1 Tax=Kosmotoga arenicorallina S304 TaxID=1453497 RepID=A0A176K4F2_9BACT|nr:sigma 54-interacting transcriptional regulator [Kosmotoga arenicorallina]OAA32501.1 hypothetical protein AT15_00030 [Kosmotoga arenicorallina S304]